MDTAATFDRTRLATLLSDEIAAFARAHPRAAAIHERAKGSLVGGVPMPWMMLWAGGFPIVADRAEGSTIHDVDGHEYVDLCLGDTGAMTGHAPEPVWRAAGERLRRGTTMMLPTEDAAVVGEQLRSRFGLEQWLLTLSATDANRHAIRIARDITQCPKVLVFSYCYHGSVDEALAVNVDGRTVARAGNVGAPVDVAQTTRAIEFNDVDALEAALAHGDVAMVLAEPAMTNIGIVPPVDGYHDALRELTRKHGTLLLIDETHTLSAGPGGCTKAWGLEPDLVTVGKAIAGGVPTGALGLSAAVVERMFGRVGADYTDVGGVGGTLAGNALSLAAARAALEEVLTEEAFAHATAVATRLREGAEEVIASRGLPWHVVQLGSRAEYRFAPEPARDGTEAAGQGDAELERYLHLYALNRGVLITPFHNMALCSGATPMEAADRHTEVFAGAVDALRAER
jgi:glutamate-1-semialdehyde 2,1-aminomutase